MAKSRCSPLLLLLLGRRSGIIWATSETPRRTPRQRPVAWVQVTLPSSDSIIFTTHEQAGVSQAILAKSRCRLVGNGGWGPDPFGVGLTVRSRVLHAAAPPRPAGGLMPSPAN